MTGVYKFVLQFRCKNDCYAPHYNGFCCTPYFFMTAWSVSTNCSPLYDWSVIISYENYKVDVKMTVVLPIHLDSIAAALIGRNMTYMENPAAVQEILNNIWLTLQLV